MSFTPSASPLGAPVQSFEIRNGTGALIAVFNVSSLSPNPFGPGVGTPANPSPVIVELPAALLAVSGGAATEFAVQVSAVNALGASTVASLQRTLSTTGIVLFRVNATSLTETQSPLQLAVGETLQLLVTVQFPQGSSPAANLTLALPAVAGGGRLELLSASVLAAGARLTSSVSGALQAGASATALRSLESASAGATDTVLFQLGSVSNSALTAAADYQAAESVQFVLTARVSAVAGNVAGASLPLSAQFDFTGAASAQPPVAVAAALTATVVEPSLSLAVSASQPTVQAGELVRFTALVAPILGAPALGPAYAVNLTFPCAAGQSAAAAGWIRFTVSRHARCCR